ncbi:hypothetical protein VTO42DRAFT_5839 [Malbranchea cinnamomea]
MTEVIRTGPVSLSPSLSSYKSVKGANVHQPFKGRKPNARSRITLTSCYMTTSKVLHQKSRTSISSLSWTTACLSMPEP